MDVVEKNILLQDHKTTGVVLIHGLTGAPTEMKPLEKYMRKLGFEVENVCLAGHGAGHAEIIASSWTEWVDSARQAVQRMLKSFDQVIIAGLSMGAVIGSIIAGEEKRVSGLVMMSPTLRYDGSVLCNSVIDWIYHSDFVTRTVANTCKVVPFVGSNFYWEELPPYGIRDERIQRQITKSIEAAKISGSNDFGSFRTYYKNLADMVDLVDHAAERFCRVSCPTLLMYTLDDTLASINNATRCYLNIGSENKAFFVLSGCDHVMTLDLQRHLVHKMVGRFVQNFSSTTPEHKTVRNMIGPVLSEAKFAKEATITSTISPEMHGLSKDEWQQIYPNKRYAHMAPVSDVDQLHSVVVRDRDQTILNLPMFIGSYQQSAQSSLPKILSNVLLGKNATVLGIGSLNHEVPGLGVNDEGSKDSKAFAAASLHRIINSIASTAKVNAISCVQEAMPSLPLPYTMLRASDNKPILPHEGIHRLLTGQTAFHHLSPVLNWLSRSIEIALPPKRIANQTGELLLDEAAVG